MKKILMALALMPFMALAVTIGEAVDAPQMTFTTGGNANWFGQTSVSHDGVDAAQSGAISDGQSTWMQTTFTGEKDVSFWWKVSSESNYDHLRVYVDDVEQGAISGDVDWTQKRIHVSGAGSHTLKWTYSKDYSQSRGSDCGWVDQLSVYNVYYVNGTTGSDDNPGTSPETAKKTIQAAIDASVDGDMILVAPGTYAPIAADNPSISIIAQDGHDETIIDGGGNLDCCAFGANLTNTIIRGFTIRNGGQGIIGGTAELCIIKNCSGQGDYHGVLRNCLLYGNNGYNGSQVQGGLCFNCTLVGPYCTAYGCSLINSIVYGGSIYNPGGSEWPGYPMREKVYTDNPHFVDATNGNYRLAADSPCIDAGNDDYVVGNTDLDGKSRVRNGIVDIGCYEFYQTWYVNGTTGSDVNPGTSPDAAKKTIQAAIDVSVDGDTILVAPGTYAPIAADNPSISIIAQNGHDETIIDGGGNLDCCAFGANLTNTIIRGFTIRNGGQGIIGGTAEWCIIKDCTGQGDYHGVIKNCLLYGNTGYNGSQVQGGLCFSCTLVGPSYTAYGCSLINSIVYGGSIINPSGNEWPGYPMREKVYTDDPHFVDAANGNYRLAADSPCIDAGNNSYVQGSVDLDGNVRVWNDTVDIGCYEYSSPLDVGLVAHYEFNGDAKDSSGYGNDGVVHGATLTTDRFGKENGAYKFDGDDDWIEVAHSSSLGAVSNAVALSFWIDPKSWWDKSYSDPVIPFVCKASSSFYEGSFRFFVSKRDGNRIVFSGAEDEEAYREGVRLCLDTWQHYVIVYNDSGTRVYRNGGLLADSTNVYEICQFGDVLAIGRDIVGGTTQYLDGALDDIRLYNRPLSAVEVKALYDSEKPKLSDGLVAHYEFNGDAKDSSGNGNDGVVHGATLTMDRFGNENGAYKFDGNDDWIEVAHSSSLGAISNAVALSFWINPKSWWDKSYSDPAIPFVCKASSSYYEGSFRFFVSKRDGNRIAFSGAEDESAYREGDRLCFDIWQHYVIVYNDSGTRVYRNGGLLADSTDVYEIRQLEDVLAIGRDIVGGTTQYLDGSLDDIRLYNRELSAVEVKAVYDSEKPTVRVWTVSFDARGGVASQDTMVVTNNTAIGELPTAERDGHKFLGWYSEIEGGTQVTPETIITTDVTFYAHWFDTSIGNVTGATNVLWRTGGDVPWATEETAEGWDVRSGAIDKNSETWVECVVTNGCRVAFQWKVSCEPEDEGEMYDFLSFSIDGEPKAAICGEVGWTNDVYCVSGAGEHILRWTYQKDNRTSAGEDCGWLGRVRVDPEVPVTFKDNGATSGEVPTIPTAYLGDAITIPGKGTLAKSCHAFGGWEYGETTYPEGAAFTLGTNAVEFVAVWNAKVLGLPILVSPATPHVTTEKIAVSLQTPASAQGIRYTIDGTEPTAEGAVYVGPFEIEDRGVTVKAVAFADDWFDSACATWELTRAPWSAAECLNAETREFSFGGNADWVRDLSVTHDGEAAMRSGTITDKQTSQILMPVTGEGTVSFWCKVSSEWDPGTKEVYDGLAIAIDGKDVYPGLIGGEVGWTNITVGVSGAGEHVICWRYQKDKVSSAGSDCAWIDEVLWQVNETVVPAAITGDRDLPISRSWIEKDLVDRYGPGKTEAFRDKYGNDYDLAVLMPNGKTMGGNPGYVWEDYIAGTDPTDTNSVFAASISMEGGVPKVIWEPDLGVERLYKVLGKTSLVGGDWQCPTNSTHRFFKVTVEMP